MEDEQTSFSKTVPINECSYDEDLVVWNEKIPKSDILKIDSSDSPLNSIMNNLNKTNKMEILANIRGKQSMLKTFSQLWNFADNYYKQMLFANMDCFSIYIDLSYQLSLLAIYHQDKSGRITSMTFKDCLETQCRNTFFESDISSDIWYQNLKIISQFCAKEFFDRKIILICLLDLLKSFNLANSQYITKLFSLYGTDNFKSFDSDPATKKLMEQIFVKINSFVKLYPRVNRHMNDLEFINNLRKNNWYIT